LFSPLSWPEVYHRSVIAKVERRMTIEGGVKIEGRLTVEGQVPHFRPVLPEVGILTLISHLRPGAL